MFVTLAVVAPFATLGAVLALASRLASRRSRVASAAGRPAVPPQAHRTVRGTAVQRAQVQPRGEMTGPFAYDNGLTIGAAEEAGEP